MHHPLEREDTNIYFYNVKGEGDDKMSLAFGLRMSAWSPQQKHEQGNGSSAEGRLRSVYLGSNDNASKGICLQGVFQKRNKSQQVSKHGIRAHS